MKTTAEQDLDPHARRDASGGCASVIVLKAVFAYTVYHFSPLAS